MVSSNGFAAQKKERSENNCAVPPTKEGSFIRSSEAKSLQELTPQQWKSGIAAWLGWLFDGLDMHLYTLVAAPFVMQLLQANSVADPR